MTSIHTSVYTHQIIIRDFFRYLPFCTLEKALGTKIKQSLVSFLSRRRKV